MKIKWMRCKFAKHVMAPPIKRPGQMACIYCGEPNLSLPHRKIDVPQYAPGNNWNLRIGRISKLLSPGFSWCGKCHTTWNWVKSHSTNHREHSGCFALCEKCWDEESPKSRLPFYHRAFGHWEDWPLIAKAVLAGK